MQQFQFKSLSMRGSRIFVNGQKQPHLKLCLVKGNHEQVIKSILFCSPLGAIFGQ